MIFLEGEIPNEPLIVMVLIRPDGRTRNVSFPASPLSALDAETVFGPAVDALTQRTGDETL